MYKVSVLVEGRHRPIKIIHRFPQPKRVAELITFQDEETGVWHFFNATRVIHIYVEKIGGEDVQEHKTEDTGTGGAGKEDTLDLGLGGSDKNADDSSADHHGLSPDGER